MKRVLIAVATVCVLIAPMASADPGHGRGHDRSDGQDLSPGLATKPYGLPPGQARMMWRRGERIPHAYIAPQYFIVEPRVYHLAPPRPGFRWIVVDGDAYLVETRSGMIADMIAGAVADLSGPGDERYGPPPVVTVDREDRWRQRYARTYTQDDDSFYQECHQSVDPAGVIGGALIGGLLGNAVGRGGGRTGATIAGVVVGGALGAALTRHLDCEDRSYAYKTYSDGFNAGQANARYPWRNPKNGHYGEFQVRDYYKDPDGFRCANYTQQIVVDGRPEAASGRACRQPDGTWAIVS
jgi:surface antigen/Ni/Co efflux regulator RcnB